jgi:hypothetical protein
MIAQPQPRVFRQGYQHAARTSSASAAFQVEAPTITSHGATRQALAKCISRAHGASSRLPMTSYDGKGHPANRAAQQR